MPATALSTTKIQPPRALAGFGAMAVMPAAEAGIKRAGVVVDDYYDL